MRPNTKESHGIMFDKNWNFDYFCFLYFFFHDLVIVFKNFRILIEVFSKLLLLFDKLTMWQGVSNNVLGIVLST